MRSSKSRSRSKTNRPRTLGNIINRVFDSSGPEGKVRGTPQQIIEKYQMLARDAQLSNDRVAAENFLQHAEHYTRLLAEAMREMAAEQESRGQQGGQNNPQNNNQNNSQGNWQNRQDTRHDGNRPDGDEGNQPYAAPYSAAPDTGDNAANYGGAPEQDRNGQPSPQYQQRAPRQNDNRQNDNRQNDNRQNDNRQNDNRQNDNRQNDTRQNDNRQNDSRQNNRPRDDRPRDDRPREDRPREERRPAPAPQLRFENGPAQDAVSAQPSPIFESPAALVAQISDVAAPKPRAVRAKRAEPKVEPKSEAIADSAPTSAPTDQIDV